MSVYSPLLLFDVHIPRSFIIGGIVPACENLINKDDENTQGCRNGKKKYFERNPTPTPNKSVPMSFLFLCRLRRRGRSLAANCLVVSV